MDSLDARIVAYLQKDGTMTNAGIAKAKGVEVSEETVRRRLKRLKNDEFIKIVAIPDARKIGYDPQVLIGLQVIADKVDAVADAMASMPEVSWVSITTGSFDVFAWATLKSSEALSDFLRLEVGQIPGIQKMETFINLDFKKQEYGLNMDSVVP